MEKGDGGEEELENIEEIIADDDKVGDAGTTSVAKHQTGNKGTSDITENSLNIRTTQKKENYSTHFLICVFVGNSNASSNNDLREASNSSKSNKSQNTRNQRALELKSLAFNQIRCAQHKQEQLSQNPKHYSSC